MHNDPIKDKRILITHPFLYEINGATNVALELAQYLQASHAKVRLYTNVFENPVRQFFEKSKIKVDIATDHPNYHFRDFDYIWVNSQTFPTSLLEELGQSSALDNMPIIIFMHMSAHEDCADEMPYIYKFEENLSSLSLFVSEEALQVGKKFFEKPLHCDYYRNPAPIAYSLINKRFNNLRNILIVSNHPCQEILDIREPLQKQGVSVDYLGITGDQYTMINEHILSKYDAVVSIGKTVQYCLVSGTPVYIYDIFGGPGWLNNNNYLKAREKNFSGRGFRTKKTETIVHEILSGYQKALKYHSNNKLKFQEEFLIDHVIPKLFQQAEKERKEITPLTRANIASHRSLLRLVEIDFNKWFQTYLAKSLQHDYASLQQNYSSLQQNFNELAEEAQNLRNQNQNLRTIVESHSVQAWLKLNNSVRKIKSIPKHISKKQ